jgi:kinesin family protein 5
MDLIKLSHQLRVVGETSKNKKSSRGHSIITIFIDQIDTANRTTSSKFVIADMAGFEHLQAPNRVSLTPRNKNVKVEETKTINESYAGLNHVMKAITGNSLKVIPFRSSKLTRLLQGPLSGGWDVELLLCCSPSVSDQEETLSTLRFGQMVMRSRRVPKIPPIAQKGSPVDIGSELESTTEFILTNNASDTASELSNDDAGSIDTVMVQNTATLTETKEIQTEPEEDDKYKAMYIGMQETVKESKEELLGARHMIEEVLARNIELAEELAILKQNSDVSADSVIAKANHRLKRVNEMLDRLEEYFK